MKAADVRLLKEPDKSFIVYHETNPFTTWHHHPEFELVLIVKGKGKRIIGDHIDRFKKEDLVLIGPYLPHQHLCDKEFYDENGFKGEGIVVQFLKDFLGEGFMDLPENSEINKIFRSASRGIKIYGRTKEKIIPHMYKIVHESGFDQLYTLFTIFKILVNSEQLKILSSPAFEEPYISDFNIPMQKALDFILQNFQKTIHIDDIREFTNMSNTAFYSAFKKTFRMSFKEYLLRIRVGYACKLLIQDNLHISEIAYDSGFENISNFNRQFKKIKGITPSNYRKNFIINA